MIQHVVVVQTLCKAKRLNLVEKLNSHEQIGNDKTSHHHSPCPHSIITSAACAVKSMKMS